MIGHDRNKLGFDGGINLDLRVAMVGIPVDILNGLLSRIDAHLGGPGELSSAVNDAGFKDARPELAAIIETRDAFKESIRVVSHVARARHTVREIKRAIDDTQ